MDCHSDRGGLETHLFEEEGFGFKVTNNDSWGGINVIHSHYRTQEWEGSRANPTID